MDKLTVERIRKEEMYSQCISCSKVVNKIIDAAILPKEEKIIGDLYKVSIGGVYNVLCKDCLIKLRGMINNELERER